jgi:hypothetical protein
MATVAPAARPVKPVSGVCRWVRRLAWPYPGLLLINGVAYAVHPLTGDLSGPDVPPVGFHLVNRTSGKWYDVTDDFSDCTCPDFVWRRADRDPKGCKHCAALRVALAS